MKKSLILFFAILSILSISSQAMAEKATLWDKTKAGASTALNWTAKTSQKGWQATKAGAGDALKWTSKKSKKGWKATKEGTSEAAEWTSKKSAQGWESTKNTANKLIHQKKHDD